MKKIISTAMLSAFLLIGCATPSYPTPPEQPISQKLQADAQALRLTIQKRKSDLKEAKPQAEIDQLNDEIAALEVRLAEVEQKISELKPTASNPT